MTDKKTCKITAKKNPRPTSREKEKAPEDKSCDQIRFQTY